MGFRMRKRFTVAPGVRLNVSKSGFGASVGGKGGRYSVHSSGRRTVSAGSGVIPGVYYQQSVGGGRRARAQAPPQAPTKAPKPGLFAPKGEKELYNAIRAQNVPAIRAVGDVHPEFRVASYSLAGLMLLDDDSAQAKSLLTPIFDQGSDPAVDPFAPKPGDVAKEMVRVTRPGGRIVMGNWIPGDPTLVAQILKISSAYSPPPPEGFVSPMTWGLEQEVSERFTAAGVPSENIAFRRDTYRFEYSAAPAKVVGEFRDYYGPTMNAFAAAGENGRTADLEGELVSLFEAQNESEDNNATSIPATFLRVTVSV